jgi:hypothetical protein
MPSYVANARSSQFSEELLKVVDDYHKKLIENNGEQLTVIFNDRYLVLNCLVDYKCCISVIFM